MLEEMFDKIDIEKIEEKIFDLSEQVTNFSDYVEPVQIADSFDKLAPIFTEIEKRVCNILKISYEELPEVEFQEKKYDDLGARIRNKNIPAYYKSDTEIIYLDSNLFDTQIICYAHEYTHFIQDVNFSSYLDKRFEEIFEKENADKLNRKEKELFNKKDKILSSLTEGHAHQIEKIIALENVSTYPDHIKDVLYEDLNSLANIYWEVCRAHHIKPNREIRYFDNRTLFQKISHKIAGGEDHNIGYAYFTINQIKPENCLEEIKKYI